MTKNKLTVIAGVGGEIVSYIKISKAELKARGIKTTYAVAGRKDGQFCILDVNPVFTKFTYLPKPEKLPLSRMIYPDYRAAIAAILSDVEGEP